MTQQYWNTGFGWKSWSGGQTPTCIFFFSLWTIFQCLSGPFPASSVFPFSICLFIQVVTASSLFFFFYCHEYAPPAAKSVTYSLSWHWWHFPFFFFNKHPPQMSDAPPLGFNQYRQWDCIVLSSDGLRWGLHLKLLQTCMHKSATATTGNNNIILWCISSCTFNKVIAALYSPADFVYSTSPHNVTVGRLLPAQCYSSWLFGQDVWIAITVVWSFPRIFNPPEDQSEIYKRLLWYREAEKSTSSPLHGKCSGS